jgi:hypothetical protein
MAFWRKPIRPTPENQAWLDAYNRDNEREHAVKRAEEEQKISSLQQVYSNMKFFDMLQLISIKYHELMAAQKWEENRNNTDMIDMMKRIINILNTYRVKTFSSEDNATIFFTFRTELRGRGGWGAEVTIVRIVHVEDNLEVKYNSSENGKDPIELPCVGVEFHPIDVVEIDGNYKSLLIEFVERRRLIRNCILTELDNHTVLTDKSYDETNKYPPHEWEHMMFFRLNYDIYRIILSEMSVVLEGLLSNVEKKTDMRIKAFENAIAYRVYNKVNTDKLGLILNALSLPNGLNEVVPQTKYHPKPLINLEHGDALKNLLDRRITATTTTTTGGKLRSAKKTSKRRSVKSKPRHYRRSVGGINRHRKKTARRWQRR